MGMLEVPFHQPTNGAKIFLTVLPEAHNNAPVLLTEDIALKIEQYKIEGDERLHTSINSEDVPLDVLLRVKGFTPSRVALERENAKDVERKMNGNTSKP